MNYDVGFVERLRWNLKKLEQKFLHYRLSTNETSIIETEHGKVKGVKRHSIYGAPYYSFEGIPYAQPPVGDLRFKTPQRPTPWTGVRDCSATKDRAMQIDLFSNKVEGSEDCLYLNVYTNNLTPVTARPVMVWIHGGGFVFGEANRLFYGPDYFMRKDVVLITFQYRLGVLGFLSLETSSLNIPGNAGLKDQVMALRWIKNNCANFGGNPNCITVFGESAGAASTHYMMLTEQARSLFQRAILMSGNALCPWASTDAKKRALVIARLAGFKGENTESNILHYLLNAKASNLIGVEGKVLTAEEKSQYILFAFGPTVEPYLTPDCVLPNPPLEMAKNAWGNSIPIMLGCTSYEGLFWLPEIIMKPSITKVLETGIALVPNELADTEDIDELGQKIRQAHVTGATLKDDYLDALSQKFFFFALHRMVLARFAHSPSVPMFLYRFDFDSVKLINPFRIKRCGRELKGVSHADELTYLFWNVVACRMPKNSREYRTIERTIDIWTKFAATGNPNDNRIDGMKTQPWEPLKESDECYKCMNINDELRLIDLPEMHKLKIWESLYDNKRELLY